MLWAMSKRHILFAALAAVLSQGCATAITPPRGVEPRKAVMQVTAYCNCQQCCGWEYAWFRRPVVSSGPNKGKPKEVGVTASGTKARRGTVAADPSLAFGTVVHVPGYGYGRVEDRGGAIRGNKLDLWFSSHQAAKEWGNRKLTVTIWPISK